MGRKGIRSKFLTCLMAASAVITGILGNVPLPVKAAEEGNYTVTFEAGKGTCETKVFPYKKGKA